MDGIILINKEKNYTSNDIVRVVKKILKTKVGHTGTLDPNATGVLPLLLGNATKISKYLINHDKEYEVILKLGVKTSTGDIEGKIIEGQSVNKDILNEMNVKKVLNSFIGKQQQIPPIYSAIKVNGRKLYDYARKGEEVEIKPRNIEIYDISLKNIKLNTNEILFKVNCSKGTYIRTLCEDIAIKLQSIGYMKELNRISVGNFFINKAITIKQLEEKINQNNFEDIIKIEDIFDRKDIINLYEIDFNKYFNGVPIKIKEIKNEGEIYRVYFANKFIGLGFIKDGCLKRDIFIKP